jgi:hypothetical protein
MTLTQLFITLYFAGFFGYAVHSLYLKSLDTKEDMREMTFKERWLWNAYLVLRPFVWPLYLLKTGPLTLVVTTLSQLFFRYYDDPEREGRHTTRGFYYFLNDVFKGKDRYKNYHYGQKTLPLNPHSPLLDRIQSEVLKSYSHYVQITYAMNEEKSDYRLHYFFMSSPNIAREKPTPYVLDESGRYTKEEFLEGLSAINLDLKKEVEEKLREEGICT